VRPSYSAPEAAKNEKKCVCVTLLSCTVVVNLRKHYKWSTALHYHTLKQYNNMYSTFLGTKFTALDAHSWREQTRSM